MIKNLILAACLALGSFICVSAQDSPRATNILGKWELRVETAQGASTLTVTFANVSGAIKGQGESQYGPFR